MCTLNLSDFHEGLGPVRPCASLDEENICCKVERFSYSSKFSSRSDSRNFEARGHFLVYAHFNELC